MKRMMVFAAIAVVCVCFAVASESNSNAGSQDDPLIHLSYLNNEFAENTQKEANKILDRIFQPIKKQALKDLETSLQEKDEIDLAKEVVAEHIYQEILKKDGVQNQVSSFYPLTLHEGDKLYAYVGTKLILQSGSAELQGTAPFINLSTGTETLDSQPALKNIQYLSSSNDELCCIESQQNYSVILVEGAYQIKRAYLPQYTSLADGLKQMALFKGTNSGYELDRSATRIEALVMLIRLMGEENEALASTAVNPFDDVAAWADRYAAYAYSKGYTKGTSASKFTPNATATANQYATFVLRALGYNDSEGDFSWDAALAYAYQTKLVTQQEVQTLSTGIFRRDYMVFLSYKALYANMKSSEATLADHLIVRGAIAAKDFEEAEKIFSRKS